MPKPRQKMSIEARAKQFMPFAAVSGLDAALEKKLKEYLAAKEPSSTADAVNNRVGETFSDSRKFRPLTPPLMRFRKRRFNQLNK